MEPGNIGRDGARICPGVSSSLRSDCSEASTRARLLQRGDYRTSENGRPLAGRPRSSTVRDLVPGSGLGFEDRGLHALRGLPEEVHLYTVLGG